MPLTAPEFELQLETMIFDFDGVIVESMDIKTKAFRALFADCREVDAIVALHQANAGIDRLIKFEMIYRDILRRPLSASDKTALAERFAALVVERVVACPLVAGAREVLETLKGRVACCIVSGTPEPELQEIVKRRGLEPYFCEVRGSPRSKSSLVMELLKTYGWHAGRVVMIGDAIADFDGARSNGVAFMGRVVQGQKNPFPREIPVVADLTRLEEVLKSRFGFSVSPIKVSVG